MAKYIRDSGVVGFSIGFLMVGTGCEPSPEIIRHIPTSVQVYAANSEQCRNGGQIIRTFRDQNADGAFNPEDPILSETPVCNGANGSDGSDGAEGATGAQGPQGENGINGTNGTDGAPAVFKMGAVGPQVAGKAYSACHHDYIYFPSSGNMNGWLLFRHQANGTEDQGSGTTGFQVWAVDITEFLLSSEVGQITYCRLQWNPSTSVLTYTVMDSSDGLNGLSGSIELE